jgi:hypothetical protein
MRNRRGTLLDPPVGIKCRLPPESSSRSSICLLARGFVMGWRAPAQPRTKVDPLDPHNPLFRMKVCT